MTCNLFFRQMPNAVDYVYRSRMLPNFDWDHYPTLTITVDQSTRKVLSML